MINQKQTKTEMLQQIKELQREIKQWEETCEILRNPKLMKSIKQSLKEFAEGKGIKLEELKENKNNDK